MRVLLAANNLNIGGPQKNLLGVLEQLSADGIRATVISLENGGVLREFVAQEADVLRTPRLVEAMALRRDAVVADSWYLFRQGHWLLLLWYLKALVWGAAGKPMNVERQRLWRRARRILPKVSGTYDLALAVSPGLAAYATVDLVNASAKYHWIVGDYSRTPSDEGIDSVYFAAMDGALTVSPHCAEIFFERFPDLERNCRTMTSVIPFSFYRAQERELEAGFAGERGTLTILTVTRLDAGKGLDLAVGAAQRLRAEGRRFQWFVLGSGPFERSLRASIEEAGVSSCFHLLGARLNTLQYVASADLVVHPSRSEGRSVAVDEALHLHKPVVVTRFRTAGEQVIDGVNGLICEMDADSLAQAVGEFFDEARRAAVADVPRAKPQVTRCFKELVHER